MLLSITRVRVRCRERARCRHRVHGCVRDVGTSGEARGEAEHARVTRPGCSCRMCVVRAVCVRAVCDRRVQSGVCVCECSLWESCAGAGARVVHSVQNVLCRACVCRCVCGAQTAGHVEHSGLGLGAGGQLQERLGRRFILVRRPRGAIGNEGGDLCRLLGCRVGRSCSGSW